MDLFLPSTEFEKCLKIARVVTQSNEEQRYTFLQYSWIFRADYAMGENVE